MTNIIKTCVDFCKLARDGMLAIFETYFDMTLNEFSEIAYGASLPPPFDAYGDMSVAAFTIGIGIIFVMSYNFVKWFVGIITGS